MPRHPFTTLLHHDEPVDIDDLLVDLVEALWEADFETTACCQGGWEYGVWEPGDPEDAEDTGSLNFERQQLRQGYVCFTHESVHRFHWVDGTGLKLALMTMQDFVVPLIVEETFPLRPTHEGREIRDLTRGTGAYVVRFLFPADFERAYYGEGWVS